MFKLVIKEKTGVIDGWLEVEGDEHVLSFGNFEEDVDRATELLAIWSDWMDREINSVQTIANGDGQYVSVRPCLVESIALVYTRS